MQAWIRDRTRRQSGAEELANSVSHGLALIVSFPVNGTVWK